MLAAQQSGSQPGARVAEVGQGQSPAQGPPLGNGIRGQVLAGSVLSGVGAYLSVRFLVRYLQTRTLYPFAAYCLIVGIGSAVYLSLR